MKEIWILNHYAKPAGMSSGERHSKFAEILIERGYNVTIFSASSMHNNSPNLIKNKEKYIFNNSTQVPFVLIKARDYNGNGKKRILNMIDYFIGILSVTKKIKQSNPDIIYASSVHPLTWIAGYILSKRTGAKFIAETRDLWPETFIKMGKIKKNSIIANILYKIEKFIYIKADDLIFSFPGGKDYVKEIGIKRENVYYINNGVDLKDFEYNKVNYVYDDKELDGNEFNIIYTGSMGIANAIEYILDAAYILKDKKLKFILFGDGYQKEKMEKKVKELGLKNIIFKGRVDKKYVPNILSKSSLNIITSLPIDLYKYGMSPNKMFEYFASEKPVVSNIVCGYDIIKKYNCGKTVDSGSGKKLADGILEFYEMEEKEYEKYCINSKKVAKEFDFDNLTNKLEGIFSKY